MDEIIRKKYIPMTETTYYTLLSVMVPRHGYAIMQYVNELTRGRIVLGTGTLYTMVGRLTADRIIEVVPGCDKKAYLITNIGKDLVRMETERLEKQLADGRKVLKPEWEKVEVMQEQPAPNADFQNGGGVSEEYGTSMYCGKHPGGENSTGFRQQAVYNE